MQASFLSALRLPRLGLGSVRQWHWVSSAVCLVGMLLFAVTGITLNHAGQIEASAHTRTLEVQLPETLRGLEVPASDKAPLPESIRQWLAQTHQISLPTKPGEWLDSEVYLALPRPGGDAWLSVDLHSGSVIYESTSRGAVAYLNDLHKGRNTGPAWSWFLDIFSVACIVFCITGLLLLHRHSAHRPTTWPLVGLGLVVPLLLAVVFIH